MLQQESIANEQPTSLECCYCWCTKRRLSLEEHFNDQLVMSFDLVITAHY